MSLKICLWIAMIQTADQARSGTVLPANLNTIHPIPEPQALHLRKSETTIAYHVEQGPLGNAV